MQNNSFSRRAAIIGAAVLPTIRVAKGQAKPGNIVISSGNGVTACAKAMEVIKAGGDTLDAVIAGVNIEELDPERHQRGIRRPAERRRCRGTGCQLHARAIAPRRCGRGDSRRQDAVEHREARADGDRPHDAGRRGRLHFARRFGYKEEDLLTERSRMAWLAWKRSMRDPGGHTFWESGVDGPPKKAAAESQAAVSACGRFADRMGLRCSEASSDRNDQLHSPEPEGRDVRDYDYQRDGVEDSRTRGRFADHRRRAVAR